MPIRVLRLRSQAREVNFTILGECGLRHNSRASLHARKWRVLGPGRCQKGAPRRIAGTWSLSEYFTWPRPRKYSDRWRAYRLGRTGVGYRLGMYRSVSVPSNASAENPTVSVRVGCA